MQHNTPSFEILIVTTSSFSKKQLCARDEKEGKSSLSPAEQLEAACWNGLLDELVPEVMNRTDYEEKIFLWQVQIRNSFLRACLGSSEVSIEKEFALDPEFFLESMSLD